MNYDLTPEPTPKGHSSLCIFCGAESGVDSICYSCATHIPEDFTCSGCDMDCEKHEFGGWVNDRQGVLCKECQRDFDLEYDEKFELPQDPEL